MGNTHSGYTNMKTTIVNNTKIHCSKMYSKMTLPIVIYLIVIILLIIAGFTPVPFKLLTISSGLIHFNFFIFILVAAVTRSSRFFLLAGLIYIFGKKIVPMLERGSGKIIIIVLIMIFIGLYIGYLIYNNYELFVN